MATVTDGLYRISISNSMFLNRISISDSMFLTGGADAPIMLLPSDGRQWWEIRRTEGGDYTIRHVNTGQYASYANDPPLALIESVRLSTQQRTWTIADGPEENTAIIGAPGTDLTLGLSPLLLYPPRVTLSPRYEQDRGWTLHPA